MKVNIKSFAHLRLAMGKSPATMEIPEGSTMADLINIIIDQYGEAARQAIWKANNKEMKITPVHDGKKIPLDTKLEDDITVVFMSIVAAG